LTGEVGVLCIAGVELRYRHDHKYRTAKSYLLIDIITKSQFGDDDAVYAGHFRRQFPNCGLVFSESGQQLNGTLQLV